MKADEIRRRSGSGKTLRYWCYACNNYQPLLLRAAEKQIQLLWLTKYGLNYANTLFYFAAYTMDTVTNKSLERLFFFLSYSRITI